MRKKYLSALLFGALLVTSAGTFTSCKDYDDEIAGLQEQVDAVKASVADLEKKIDAGNWVTAVNSVEGGFEITFNDGQKYTIVNGKDGADGAAGENGQDGKPGTTWRINSENNNWEYSEDGGSTWKDTGICAKGEKGDKGDQGETGPVGPEGPQGPQGEAGKSPFIDPETKNWFVYEYNEETGEWDAKDAGICAEGTRSYVVDDGGDYYVLNMPDENGEFVQIKLPKSPDTFTVEALAETVTVESKTGVWKPKTASANYLALAEKFPEIKDIKEGTMVKQGNHLPVIVSPSNVALTDGMTYALYNVKGDVVATLANPTKGLPEDLSWNSNGLLSRSSADECFWTLEMTPVLNENGEFIEWANVNDKYSLAIVKANGAVNKTAFDYKITHTASVPNVTVRTIVNAVETKANQEGVATIDLMKDVFNVENGYGKYYFCEIASSDPATVEKYGIKLENNILTVKFLAGETFINLSGKLNIKCTALGLNGSTAIANASSLRLSREISSVGEGAFTDKEFVLTTTATGGRYVNKLRWNVEDLGFSALELKNFMGNTYSRPHIILEYKNGDNWTHITTKAAIFYKADGTTINPSQYETEYAKAVTYGIDLDNNILTPEKEYRLTLQKMDGAAITFKQEAKMSVSNPTVTITPKAAVNENGNYLLIEEDATINGSVPLSTITGNLNKPTYVALGNQWIDVDHEIWVENDNQDVNAWGANDFISGSNFEMPAYNKDKADCQLGKARTIRGKYTLFDNPENIQEFEFKVVFKSAIYSETPSSVISHETSLLTIDKTTGSQNTWHALTTKYALGTNKGKVYTMFGGNDFENVTIQVTDYSKPKGSDNYVINKLNQPIEIDKDDWGLVGLSPNQILAAKKVYFVVNQSTDIASDGNGTYWVKWSVLADKDGALEGKENLYNKYSEMMTFEDTTGKTYTKGTDLNKYVKSVKFEPVKAVSGISVDPKNGKVTVTRATSDVTINIKLTVIDMYNQKMEYTYPVVVKKR